MTSMTYRSLFSSFAVLSLLACQSPESKEPSSTTEKLDPQSPKPTIVLVHGAFADASSWSAVVDRLEQRGYPVMAPPNLLRGPDADAAALASVLKTVNGPIVLVGHSYGGIVISGAAQNNPAVKALVYVAAFMPDTGESVSTISGKYAPTKFSPAALRVVPYTPACGGGNGADAYLKSDLFHDLFAADVPESTTRVMAATQRPIEASAIGATFTGSPAWKTVPSWALVSRSDQMISPDAERAMAQRAKSHVVEVDASHAVAVSQPDLVANLIADAAHSVH